MEFFRRTYWRLIWSWKGVADTWKNESSLRYWVWANLVAAGLAFYRPLSGGERALVLSLGLLVLAFEAINTAVEITIDYISTERHPEAGRAKDAASAAVFLSAIAAGVGWTVVLIRVFST